MSEFVFDTPDYIYGCIYEILNFNHKDFGLCYSYSWKTSFLKIRRHGEDKYYDVPNVICELLDKYVEWYDYDNDYLKINVDNIKTELGFNLLKLHINTYAYSEDGWIYDN